MGNDMQYRKEDKTKGREVPGILIAVLVVACMVVFAPFVLMLLNG